MELSEGDLASISFVLYCTVLKSSVSINLLAAIFQNGDRNIINGFEMVPLVYSSDGVYVIITAPSPFYDKVLLQHHSIVLVVVASLSPNKCVVIPLFDGMHVL